MPVGGVQGGAPADYVRNPRLHYKLDLGEPGIAAPASASQSILKVTSHEQQNINRFRAEAAREGGYVIYDAITLSLSYQGSFLAARGGLSTARVIYPDGRGPFPGGGDSSLTPFDRALDDRRRARNDAADGGAAAGQAENQPGGLAGEEEDEEDANGGLMAEAQGAQGEQQIDGLKKAARAELQKLDRFLRSDAFNEGGNRRKGANAPPPKANAGPPPVGEPPAPNVPVAAGAANAIVPPPPPPPPRTELPPVGEAAQDEAAQAGAMNEPAQEAQEQENRAYRPGAPEEARGQEPANGPDSETAQQARKQRATFLRTQIESAIQRLDQIDRFKGDQGVEKAQEQIFKAIEDMMKLTFGMARAARGGDEEGADSPAKEMMKASSNDGAGGAAKASSQAQTAVANKLNTLLNTLGSLVNGQAVDAMA